MKELLRELPEIIAALQASALHTEQIAGELAAQALRSDAQTAVLYQLVKEVHALRFALAAEQGPSFQRPLHHYLRGDWLEELGAEALAQDASGPTIVSYAGHQWKRRSGSGRYGDAIWFSRTAGPDGEDGKPGYTRLITFKDLDPPEPMAHGLQAKMIAALAGERAGADALAEHFATEEHDEPPQVEPLVYGDETAIGDNAAEVDAFTRFQSTKDRVPNNPEELRAWYKKTNGA